MVDLELRLASLERAFIELAAEHSALTLDRVELRVLAKLTDETSSEETAVCEGAAKLLYDARLRLHPDLDDDTPDPL